MLNFTKSLTVVICPETPSPEKFDFYIDRLAAICPDGFTVTDAQGGWRMAATGETVTEPVKLFTVWGPSGHQVRQCCKVLDAMRIVENQEAVSAIVQGARWQAFVWFDQAECETVIKNIINS